MCYDSRMSFGRMNDNYYQPSEDRLWDEFVDYCHDNDLSTDEEDFEAWREARCEPDPDFDRQYELENFGD